MARLEPQDTFHLLLGFLSLGSTWFLYFRLVPAYTKHVFGTKQVMPVFTLWALSKNWPMVTSVLLSILLLAGVIRLLQGEFQTRLLLFSWCVGCASIFLQLGFLLLYLYNLTASKP